ncbi:alpha/beta hydrolase [Nocardioides sp. T2.26MG-1]|uniref:alpha/beta hydrolase n=1 Tax=Nocardioides sp. T2.26MG-1 TaxID=3041166 RepID=UPI00247745AD|nr:alpha/beta fold hydrolase [Nocardioides sp. T2.26MG-1]CAI9412482.1 Putative aminoacrylate hydrolase RutD [Nocardioides sp. T2.26MG-1]
MDRYGDAADHASRARLPDTTGTAERDGVCLAWASYGRGPTTLVMMPTWSIVPSRVWKAQVPYLARHYRVITFDGRGSGASSRPVGAAAYTNEQYAADTVAVMDAAGVDRAVLVSLSCGGAYSVHVAAERPDRVQGLFAIAPACGFDIPDAHRDEFVWDVRPPHARGWAKYNRHHWLEGGYEDFLHFFFGEMYPEPHSTKQIEDAVAWGLDLSPATLVDTTAGRLGCDGATCTSLEPLCARVRCPVTVLHGTEDHIRPPAIGARLAELTGGALVLAEGCGHGPMARDPVLVNHEIRRFVEAVAPQPATRTWIRPARRGKRALYLSSPIGLGHARRDLAVADELRALHPDLRIDWLAQDPVTRVLTDRGEHVHPASRHLANESGHVEHEAGEHDLHAFQAIRRMDEILVNNFMVFDELLECESYDLVIGDEAWDVDHFLHENPELKRSAYAWFTDFVGWLPMPEGGDREVTLTADVNAEMIEQRARHPWLRDRSIFVGDPEDVVTDPFGPGLPGIREWTEDTFDFAGYVTGFDPARYGEAEEARARLGYHPDERVCVVTVGGSGVGLPLLRRILDAVPLARRLAPDLRFVVVTGPRIDPGALPRRRGATVRGYLPDLAAHLAACDVAVVQGGLTTCMELTALRKPFLYVPLRRHFEQNLHVRHRLERYRAGTCVDYADALDPGGLAEAIVKELGRDVDYRPVETDGAARAARLLSGLL